MQCAGRHDLGARHTGHALQGFLLGGLILRRGGEEYILLSGFLRKGFFFLSSFAKGDKNKFVDTQHTHKKKPAHRQDRGRRGLGSIERERRKMFVVFSPTNLGHRAVETEDFIFGGILDGKGKQHKELKPNEQLWGSME